MKYPQTTAASVDHTPVVFRQEPMRGVAFLVHSASGTFREEEDAAAVTANPYGPMSGQVMVATKDACRYCLLRKGFSRISEVGMLKRLGA